MDPRTCQRCIRPCDGEFTSCHYQETSATITSSDLPLLSGVHTVHLEQVFQNLISNALKYRSDKSPAIHVSAELAGNEWLFAVSDNGIGIDPRYERSNLRDLQTPSHIQGLFWYGIGLAICQKIVERAGGRIWVESQLGERGIFFFTIPDRKQSKSPSVVT